MLLKATLRQLQQARARNLPLAQRQLINATYMNNQMRMLNSQSLYASQVIRSFAKKNKEQQPKPRQAKKEEEKKPKEEPQQQKEDKKQEKEQTTSSENDKKEEKTYDFEEDEETTNQFKSYRRFAFILGKTFKYTCWAASAIFMYHMYVVTYNKDPESAHTLEPFLEAARFTRYFYKDLTILLTRPPVEKLLLDRPPMPPGYQPMKVLVLNLNGTIVTSEYKLGVGFEILKRPGLSVFLQRMAQKYELVLFGDQDQGFIHEVAEALDPNMMMFQGRLGRESTLLKGQKYIKDFSYLGRPIKEVVYLDFTDELVPYHSANTIILPEWTGDMDDRALYDILPFLESMANKPVDVRDEIRKYGQTGTAQKFNTVQSQRRDMLIRQRDSGVTGMMGRLASQQKQSPNMPRIEPTNIDFGKEWK